MCSVLNITARSAHVYVDIKLEVYCMKWEKRVNKNGVSLLKVVKRDEMWGTVAVTMIMETSLSKQLFIWKLCVCYGKLE